jgi:hypothetical protein
VTTSDLTLPAGQTVAASSLFSVTDPNGYAISDYQFWDSTQDPGSGHFYVNGVQQAPGAVIDVPASQLDQVTFVSGSIGNFLQVRAFDGVSWSGPDDGAWAPFNLGVQTPVVTTSDISVAPGQSVAASGLLSASAPGGGPITEYQFWDSTRDPASGHFYVDGVQQAPGTVIDVSASQLGQVAFVAGSIGNTLQVRAFDGVNWSAGDSAAWAPFSVSIDDSAATTDGLASSAPSGGGPVGPVPGVELLAQYMASAFAPSGLADSSVDLLPPNWQEPVPLGAHPLS